jgi:4-amino-4-deoxy-L-arabinose transferase-like glycosyltransferase
VTNRFLVLFFLIFAFLSLGTLGVRPLYKADESRYAEIPREMAASGDWVTPRLNDFKYFEKPPLQYWGTAVFFKAFGEHDWSARLWTALAALAGVVLVFYAGKKLFSPEAGALGALVLAGCPLYVLLGQINTLDMGLAFFLSAAIFAFALGRYYLFWAACALAVLSKGLIGIVLPMGAIGLYVLIKRDWPLIRKMKLISGSLIFLAIAAPWFIAVSIKNEEFAHFFFVQEHFQRFTSKMHGRDQPMWFFLPILAFGIAPWLLPFFASLGEFFKRQKFLLREEEEQFNPQLFLALWAIVVFGFFSVSGSKLPSYILPMFPALALLIGRSLAITKPLRLLAAQAVLACVTGIGIAFLGSVLSKKFNPELAAGYAPWLEAAGVLLAAASIAAGVAAWRGRVLASVALLAIGSFACALTALAGHGRLSPAYSIASQAGIASQTAGLSGKARVFAVDFYDHTLPWYFRRPVTMVGYKDELEEAIKWEPQKFIPDLAGFARAWAAAPEAYAVFSSSSFENLKKETNVPMEIVSRGPRYIIVRKP